MPSVRQTATNNSRWDGRSAQRRRIAPAGSVTSCRYSVCGACRIDSRIQRQSASGASRNSRFRASGKLSASVLRQQDSGSVPMRGQRRYCMENSSDGETPPPASSASRRTAGRTSRRSFSPSVCKSASFRGAGYAGSSSSSASAAKFPQAARKIASACAPYPNRSRSARIRAASYAASSRRRRFSSAAACFSVAAARCAGVGALLSGRRSFGAWSVKLVQRPAGASGSASVSSSGSSCEAGQSVSWQRPFFRACTIRSPYPQRSRAIPSASVRMTAAGKTSDALRMPNVTSAPAAGRPSFSRTRTASRRTGA